jgi:hypothetical protein
MIFNLDINKIVKDTERKAELSLVVTGAQLTSWVCDKIRANGSVVTGNMVNSISFSTESFQSAPNGSPTNGKKIEKGDKLTLRVGTNVVYGPRVEFGYEGTDSLGRKYNQKPKSFLRNTAIEKKEDIGKVFALGMKSA